MSGPPPPGAALSFEANARRIGRYCWVEMRAFEALGAWSASAPEPAVRATLATHSRQHAWHAELWHDLLPVVGEAAVDGFIAPPNDDLVAFAAALVEPVAPDLTIEKLVGAYRVLLPRSVAAYSHHLRSASPITDAPTIRALRLTISDHIDHWREGEALLQALVTDDAAVDRAAAHHARLEKLVAAAGGIVGHGTLDLEVC